MSAPSWYVAFCRLYWPAWWAGTGLIVLSWIDLVTPTVGWIGFIVALGASVSSAVLPRFVRVQPDEVVVLDTRMLKTKDDQYRDAIERFINGVILLHDGVYFALRNTDKVVCAVVASSQLRVDDDLLARQVAQHARSVFDDLRSASADIATLVDDRKLHISIYSNSEENVEVCRIVKDDIEWTRSDS